jgi:hypothetical protein
MANAITRRKFESAANALQFLQGGKATFTLQSLRSGAHFTYRMNESEDGKCFFVSVLTGPDNTSRTSYSYLGYISAESGLFRSSRKSRISPQDKRFAAFDWSYRALAAGTLPRDLEVWHEGRCCRCGRALTVPESVASGLGPECASRVGVARRASALHARKTAEQLMCELLG